MKKISVITSAYNEEECITEFVLRVSKVFQQLNDYELDLTVVDNGSTDKTLDILIHLQEEGHQFRVLRLSRNFGMDGGIAAGLAIADGDAAVLMCADLQDPPELIPDLIGLWELGNENIFMTVRQRRGTGLLRRINSVVFYRLLRLLSDQPIPENASDFRLVDRKVYETVRSMAETELFLRAQFAWVGFRSVGIQADRPPRHAGESKATSLHVFELAIRGLLAHSNSPLRVISAFALVLSVLCMGLLAALSLSWIFGGVPFEGFGSIIGFNLLGISIISGLLGVLTLYIGQIHKESKARPKFIVADTFETRTDITEGVLSVQTEEDDREV